MFNDTLIPDEIISSVAEFINQRSNKNYRISILETKENSETPHYLEMVPFENIDLIGTKFYAIDGSYNYQEFFNGLSVGVYCAGYICYHEGKQLKLNTLDIPLLNGIKYFPNNILITNENHRELIFDELLTIPPVKAFLEFLGDDPENIWAWGTNTKTTICSTTSKLFSFCQNVLEWSLVYEISTRLEISNGDFILRDGNLRSQDIKEKYLAKLARHLKDKNIYIIGITKKSPIKMELSYTFRTIDSYLQDDLKYKYPFINQKPTNKRLCCWFEVPETVLVSSYGGSRTTNIDLARKNLTSSKGFGLFFASRLDYVEKLQNFDWVIADLNILDAIPGLESEILDRDIDTIFNIFNQLTHLTQEHYILGYPYPLVEVHNFVTLKKDFKDEIIRRLKYYLYKEQRIDNVDIENLFLDIHDYF
jgi:hypothetical protein